MEQSEANLPQERLAGLDLDSLKARSITVLAQVKHEVEGEKVDKKTPITDMAIENFHFIGQEDNKRGKGRKLMHNLVDRLEK
ncbi:hypothetical protein HYS90_02660, partial [Candidatus Curtissbacteria bacterium]|nr:hypothetical protein [Candidatus Curtissbacteria bacterium]